MHVQRSAAENEHTDHFQQRQTTETPADPDGLRHFIIDVSRCIVVTAQTSKIARTHSIRDVPRRHPARKEIGSRVDDDSIRLLGSLTHRDFALLHPRSIGDGQGIVGPNIHVRWRVRVYSR